MRLWRWITAGVLLQLVLELPSFADDRSSLVGTWAVVAFEAISPATGEREPARGDHPSGYTIFTPEGRMSVLITNDGRRPPSTSQDRADLFHIPELTELRVTDGSPRSMSPPILH